jgi:hypothetical protein
VIAGSGDAEVLREPIGDAARRLLAIEVSAVCGAGHGKRTPERESQRNGYRARQWGEEDRETVRWTVSPANGRRDRADHPQAAQGRAFPVRPFDRSTGSIDALGTGRSLPEPRRTAEKALMAFANVARTIGATLAHLRLDASLT